MNEFAIEWLKGGTYAAVTVPDNTRMKSRLLALAKEHPNRVKIIAMNADGSIFAHIPVSFVQIRSPR